MVYSFINSSKMMMVLCFSLFLYVLALAIFGGKNESRIIIDEHFSPKAITGKRFLSIGLDTSNIYDGLEKLNLASPKLVELTSKLSPAYLRFGGTMADRLIFVNKNKTLRPPIAKFLPYFAMSRSDFFQIASFCRKSNIRLIFDLNVLLRNGYSWNPSNAIRLFQVAKNNDIDLDWQLGNEPNSFQHVFNTSITPRQLGDDYRVLRNLVKKYFPNSLVIGPETTRPQPNRPECVRYMKKFLSVAYRYVDAMGWHQYYLNARTATLQEFWDPSTLNLLQSQIDTMIENTRNYLAYLKMWLTETSSAYGGGAPHLSNSYAAIPLWLDKLGTAAKNGIQVVARQSLLGGNYSLIDENHNPLPDYWVSVLYKELVGNKVVECSVTSSVKQRFYCHCSTDANKRNIVLIYGMNLENKVNQVEFLGSAFKSVSQIDEYLFTAPEGDRMSKNILLNNILLKYDTVFPAMLPKVLKLGQTIVMPAYSFGFWKIYDTSLSYCAIN